MPPWVVSASCSYPFCPEVETAVTPPPRLYSRDVGSRPPDEGLQPVKTLVQRLSRPIDRFRDQNCLGGLRQPCADIDARFQECNAGVDDDVLGDLVPEIPPIVFQPHSVPPLRPLVTHVFVRERLRAPELPRSITQPVLISADKINPDLNPSP